MAAVGGLVGAALRASAPVGVAVGAAVVAATIFGAGLHSTAVFRFLGCAKQVQEMVRLQSQAESALSVQAECAGSAYVGAVVAFAVGLGVGLAVGFAVGFIVGLSVGLAVGFSVGLAVGFGVGRLGVGLGVGLPPEYMQEIGSPKSSKTSRNRRAAATSPHASALDTRTAAVMPSMCTDARHTWGLRQRAGCYHAGRHPGCTEGRTRRLQNSS